MKSETRLDSAVFQLTPTRTRYDLIIIANGKREKIASGLLKPFLQHLKTAQNEIAKGGYSIRLEPDAGSDPVWFTKGIVERFVRFVSTPEVLERVNNLESEILQIEEAIAIQGNDNISLSIVEDHHSRTRGIEGTILKTVSFDKCQPGLHPAASNGSTMQEENPKVQLLRALDNRRAMLRKEQDMAFARAKAAGFDMDHVAHLISFAKRFGASRLLEACLRFVELWRAKHETGHWPEMVSSSAMTSQYEVSSLKASGITRSGDIRKHKELAEARPAFNGDLGAQTSGKDENGPQVPLDAHKYYHGHFQNPTLPWPMHSTPGPPVFQLHPTKGMQYYQNNPGSAPMFQSPYPPVEDPGFNTMQSNGHGKKNAKYIVSKRHDASGSESQSTSEAETEEEIECLQSDVSKKKLKNTSRSLKKKGSQTKSVEGSNTHEMDRVVDGQAEDAGNWQVFQNFLLRCKDEDRSNVNRGTLSHEEKTPSKRRLTRGETDPMVPPERDVGDAHRTRVDFDSVNGNACRIKQVVSKEELLFPRDGSGSKGTQLGTQFKEIEVGRGRYQRTKADDFIIHGPLKRVNDESSSDRPVENEYENSGNFDKNSLRIVTDESYILPRRAGFQDALLTDKKTVIGMTSDLPSTLQRSKDPSKRTNNQHSNEPHDLSLMPKRGMEKKIIRYDPAKDFGMQIPVGKAKNRSQKDVTKSDADKERKLRHAQDGLEKRKTEAMMRKEKNSKLNPSAEARARAEKLRAFKADLQKAKKEKEEEEAKRLEALKRERQRRIAVKSSLKTAQSMPKTQHMKAPMLRKPSPSSYRGSKFRDPVSASSTSQSKLSIRSTSAGPNNSHKVARINMLNGGNHLSRDGLRRSLTPMPELKRVRKAQFSPNSYKGSKFSGAPPASSSSSQKLPLRANSLGSDDSQNTTKIDRSKDHTRLSRSGLRQSVASASLPEMKKETMKSRMPTRLSPSAYKGSKFSDSAPASASPLQKLLVRRTPAGSNGSLQVAKINRVDGGTQLSESTLRRSVTPLPGPAKESERLMPEAKGAFIQARRLPDAKSSSIRQASSLRSIRSNTMTKKIITSEPQADKISAILRLDQSKSASLPELKLKISRGLFYEAQKNSGAMETVQKETGIETSVTSEKANEITFLLNNNEDNPVIEKTVLMIENGVAPAPTVQGSEKMINIGGRLHGDEVQDATECRKDKQKSVCEIVNCPKEDPQKCGSSSITEKRHQAHFAKATSFGDLITSNTEGIEECLDHKTETVPIVRIVPHVSNSVDLSSAEEIHEKHPGKDSSKGFRKLLKFGRKVQSAASGEHN